MGRRKGLDARARVTVDRSWRDSRAIQETGPVELAGLRQAGHAPIQNRVRALVQPRPKFVIALVRDRAVQARLRRALDASDRIAFCAEREDLLRHAAQAPISLVVADLWDNAGRPTAPTIRQLRAGFPAVRIVAHCVLSPEASREVLAMARAGVDGLVFEGYDDIGTALRRVLDDAGMHCMRALLTRELGVEFSDRIWSALCLCFEHPHEALSVSRLAECVGTQRRTLLNRTTREALPSPGVLIAWCRLLMAARMLEDPARSVEQIALSLDFPSATALRNMLRRYTGLRPSEVREHGGLRCVLQHFREALSLHRARTRPGRANGDAVSARDARLPFAQNER